MNPKTKRYLGALGMALLWVFCLIFAVDFVFAYFGPEYPGPRRDDGLAWFYILERLVLWGLLPVFLVAGMRNTHGAAVLGMCAAAVVDAVAFAFAPMHSMHGRPAADFALFQAIAVPLIVPAAILFFRWTLLRRNLPGRMILHFIYYAVLLLVVVPSLIQAFTGESMTAFQEREAWLNRLVLQLIFPAGILGWTAAGELARRGGGTPMPWDPPRRLVVTGPYAYLADPLRLSKTLLLLTWAIFLGNIWIAAAAMIIPLYALTFARLFEERELKRKHAKEWREYRLNVRAWLPRWTPWRSPHAPTAILRIDSECGACSALGRWFEGSPGLSIACIRTMPAGNPTGDEPAERPIYDPGDGGPHEEGIAALARALEHRNLGFAFIGWCIRMPILRPILQIIFDAVTEKTPGDSASLTPPAGATKMRNHD